MIGALMVVTGFVVIMMIHEAGHLVAAKMFGIKATQYFLGFGPTLWSRQFGETEYGVKAIPAGGYVRIIGMNPSDPADGEEMSRMYISRPFWQKTLVVMSGIGMHFVLAVVLIWFANVVVGKTVWGNPELEIANVILTDEEGLPTGASIAGLAAGDVIISIDGRSISDWSQLTSILKNKPDQYVSLGIIREDQVVDFDIKLTSKLDQVSNVASGFLGITPKLTKTKERDNPVLGIGSAIYEMSSLTNLSILGIWEFASNFWRIVATVFSTGLAPEELRPVSVIGITQIGAASQESGFNVTLRLIAYVSIFVGVVNALPLYPLDGGHFAIALLQKLTGKYPDMGKVSAVGAMVLILLVFIGVLGVYLDIVSPLTFD